MKLLIKLAIVALLANAAYRVGSEYLTYMKFREDVREAAIFKSPTNEDLRRRIMESARRYDLPLAEDGLQVQREDRRVRVECHYRKEIEVVPTFKYSWPFDLSVDTTLSTSVRLLPPPPPR